MERLIHYVWKYKLFSKSALFTTSGAPLEVIDPGIINRGSGPDFLHAKIKIDEVLWAGHVVVKTCTPEWGTVGQLKEKTNEPVILNIIGSDSKSGAAIRGGAVPVLLLAIPDYIRKNYETLKRSDRFPSCHSVLQDLSKLKVHSWMSALVNERFEKKTDAIHQRLELTNQDWEAAFFVTLARNFAFGLQSDLFEQWAQNIPLGVLGKHRDDLMQIEALFFGQSGLLRKEIADEYYCRLQKEYRYLAHKFSLTPGSAMRTVVRIRPYNHPHLRIAQLAKLYHEKTTLFSQLMEAKELDQIFELLKVQVEGYWKNHLSFGREAVESERKLSLFSMRLIVINTVVPFLYAYGNYRANECMKENATRFLEEMPPEENHIIRAWRSVGVKVENASDSQAMIQLKKEYCEKRKCLFCRFGYEFITRKQENEIYPS